MQHIPSELKIVTALVKYAGGVSHADVQGLKDTAYKIWACYLAKKVTGCSHAVIAQTFNINPNYMQSRLEDFSIGFLLDLKNKAAMDELCQLYKDLEGARANA